MQLAALAIALLAAVVALSAVLASVRLRPSDDGIAAEVRELRTALELGGRTCLPLGATVVLITLGGKSIRGVVTRDLEPEPGAGGVELAAAELLQPDGSAVAFDGGRCFVPRASLDFVQIVPAVRAHVSGEPEA